MQVKAYLNSSDDDSYNLFQNTEFQKKLYQHTGQL